MAVVTDCPIETTKVYRNALSNLQSEYFRQMGSLGYHRIAVGEEYSIYYWSKEDTKDVPCFSLLKDQLAIPCPF